MAGRPRFGGSVAPGSDKPTLCRPQNTADGHRPRTDRDTNRCIGSSRRGTVEFRCEKSRRGFQDLISPPQLRVFLLQTPNFSVFITADTRSISRIHLRSNEPAAQCLSSNPQLRGNLAKDRVLRRRILIFQTIRHHANRPILKRLRITLRHSSYPLKNRPELNPERYIDQGRHETTITG